MIETGSEDCQLLQEQSLNSGFECRLTERLAATFQSLTSNHAKANLILLAALALIQEGSSLVTCSE